MTAKIISLRPDLDNYAFPQPIVIDDALYEAVGVANNIVFPYQDVSSLRDSLVLFTDERYPGRLLADVAVRPNGYFKGLFCIRRSTYCLVGISTSNYKYFT